MTSFPRARLAVGAVLCLMATTLVSIAVDAQAPTQVRTPNNKPTSTRAGTSAGIPASTPIRFAWPAPPDAKTYGDVEVCAAMYNIRVFRMFRRSLSDTLLRERVLYSRPFPSEMANDLRRCAEPFTVDRLLAGERPHLNAAANAYLMLLVAGRNADALAFATRWVGAIGPAEADLRREGINRFFSVALDLLPTRWDDAWAIVDLHDDVKDRVRKLALGVHIMNQAHYSKGDTVQLLKAARYVVRTQALLPDSITKTKDWLFHRAPGHYRAKKFVNEAALMDSIAHSTEAYVRYLDTLQKSLGLTGQENFPKADSVHGEYWFPNHPSTGRPARGVVSVVVATPDNECNGCREWLSILRRAHQRFPSVEFTLLAQTRGHHGTVLEPVGPDVEARLIDSVYRTTNQLPATVVVHRTRFERVEDPDRRRVNIASPNAKSYNTMCVVTGAGTKAYIVDRAGVVVSNVCLGDATARWQLEKLLEALVRQR